ncbi:MAG TPA: aldo/keto reductase [Treponema sp.]|nr:aldo/keto reductase [Treponema sp.]
MRTITLGRTGITSPQNAFGALPIQRDDFDTAQRILRRAYEGGMTFFDTARLYSDSEEKMGAALSDVRNRIAIATKTMAKTPDEMKRQLETSLRNLRTDYVDIYQFHCAEQCYRPGDGTGMYETMESFRQQGMVRHIGITAHKIGIAEEAVRSGLYETLQFPFSYLSGSRETKLVELCKEHDVGFIAMKGLAGGLITNAKAAYTFMTQFSNVLPIWGVQHMHELEQWLAFMEDSPEYDAEMQAFVERDRKEFGTDFCRGCGYCMPCPQGIIINQCARMSQMVRRAPSAGWLTEQWQQAFRDVLKCTGCGACKKKCPYGLDIPVLLKKNYDDYQNILSGKTKV